MKNLKNILSFTCISIFLSNVFLFGQSQTHLSSDEWEVYNRSLKIQNDELYLDAAEGDGVAWLKEINISNGTIELEIKGKNTPGRSFVGLAFHGIDNENYDAIYFRPFNFKSETKADKSVQYISHPNYSWHVLRGKYPNKFEGKLNVVPTEADNWIKVKVSIQYPSVKVYIDNSSEPTLEIDQLSTAKSGRIGLWVGNNSEGLFRKLKLSPSPKNNEKSIIELPRMKDWFLSSGNWQNDPQLYTKEYGTGDEVVIMLHGGWGGEHSGLVEAVEPLKDDYRFIFYDQRGSLRSPFADSLISFESHINDIELIRKELNLNELTIVGHSMGAILGSAYASTYPQRIKKLVLLAPPPLKNPLPKDDMSLLENSQRLVDEFLNRKEVNIEIEKYNLNSAPNQMSSRSQTALFRINFAKRMLYDVSKWPQLAGGRAIYKGHVFGLTAATYPKAGWDFVSAFAEADFPVSIISGDHDFLDMGNGLIKKWTTNSKNIELKIIERAGHIIWIDQRESFNNALSSSLKDKEVKF